jgi:hypothetical protein
VADELMTRAANQVISILAIFTLFWLGAFVAASFYPPTSPYRAVGIDRVVPTVARAGDRVAIFRNFDITRDSHVFIGRSMERLCGLDVCEVAPLKSDSLNLGKGPYRDLERIHVLPSPLTPGHWRFVFVSEYENLLGATLRETLPLIPIEIVP